MNVPAGTPRIRMIHTDRAPAAGGHYSQAVCFGELLFTAGLLPIEPGSGEKILGSIEEQTERVLANLGAVLEAAGSTPGQVLKTTIYVTDITLWGRVNAVYAHFFGDHRPARTIVPVPELHHGFLIEVDAIAVAGSDQAR